MPIKLFDVHAHVQFHAFKDDVDVVIGRARASGVGMINVGTQKDTSAAAVNLTERYPDGVYATVGLHPIHTERSFHDEKELDSASDTKSFVSRAEEFDYAYYKDRAIHPKVVGIGECGLDYYRLGEETKQKQREAFEKQIALSLEIKKPLMIHCRRAFEDLIDVLQKTARDTKPSVVHFFSGTKGDAQKLLDLGFSFSFGGVVTFARDYDEIVRYTPLDRILLETDAPYVAPVPYRGKRNEPAYVVETAKKIAELKTTSFDEVAERTVVNAKRIFNV